VDIMHIICLCENKFEMCVCACEIMFVLLMLGLFVTVKNCLYHFVIKSY